ncbi:MAG: hypothetical protein KGJ43_07685, partial [Acidobacteriota bacterium]|nr:hypothetical protein [Acidobacteriota bacterium]
MGAAAAFAACALALAGASSALAGPFPIEETFTNATFGNANWKKGGSAELTATEPGNGWLRLTKAEGSKFGYAYYNEAFPSTNGVLAEFEYADYGGTG